MSINKIYAHNLPKVNSYVNFIFTSRDENLLHCLLLDYNVKAIMPLNLLTTKRKIRSMNKLAPLDKPLIGLVDNIDNNVITLSIAYNDPDSEEYKLFIDNNMYIYQLRKKIMQYSHTHNISIDEILETYIYPLDQERINVDSTYNLYMYIINNIDKIYDETFKNYLIECHKEFISTETKAYETKFKFISTGGIEHTKNIFKTLLNKYDGLNVNIISTPEYKIYSKDTLELRNMQNQFIEELTKISTTYEPKVHFVLC